MKTGRLYLLLTLFSALTGLALLAGCQAAQVEAGIAENGESIDLAPGQMLSIRLDSNPTTGYSWAVIRVDQAILEQQGEAVFVQENGQSNLVGAGGTETYRFKALREGETVVELGYLRPFEKGVAPINTYTLQVTVH